MRRLTVDDCTSDYVRWLNDPRVNRFLETRFSSQTLESVRSFVAEKADSSTEFLYGIFVGKEARHIGNIKLGPVRIHHLSAFISLFIGEEAWWGKGLASRSIYTLSRHAFTHSGLKKLHAGIYAANTASLHAFLKAGYRKEGLQRSQVAFGSKRDDVQLVGLTAKDWNISQ
ncbi:MAG: GNAT family N-acetyltransferase [Nitratireductor sp.]|nr:GNAT family N-acetyltransferase [Nitratireductor sp.]